MKWKTKPVCYKILNYKLMEDQKTPEKTNPAETKKQNQDFQNIPASSTKENPPAIDKKDIHKSSELNEDGRTEDSDNKKGEN